MMSNCTICNKKQTRLRPLSNNICNECSNIDNPINVNDVTVINSVLNTTEMNITSNHSDSGDVIYIDERGKHLDVKVDEHLLLQHENPLDTQEDFKNTLLASLYSQVEFLRNEIEEKNLLIRSLIIRDSDM